MGLSGRNRHYVAQPPHALKQRVQTRCINAVIIGYNDFQMSLSFLVFGRILMRPF
jgi:hypothetical protein